MPTKAAVPTIAPSIGESLGIVVRTEIVDAESSIARGYRAASDPTLVEARKASNVARTSALTAKLLADLAK